jgi:putative ABC transport system permease protein
MKINLRDFRIGWRLLVKEPAYSAVVILGLAVGFCRLLPAARLRRHSLPTTATCPTRARLPPQAALELFPRRRLGQRRQPAARDAALASGVPLRPAPSSRNIDIVGARRRQSAADGRPGRGRPGLPQHLRRRVLAGDLPRRWRGRTAGPDRETALRKLFGNAAPVSARPCRSRGKPYQVMAVLADQPAATTLPYEALAGTGTILRIWNEEYRKPGDDQLGFVHAAPVYLKLGPGADPQAVIGRLQPAMRPRLLPAR